MPFSWRDYLAVARELATPQRPALLTEARERAAISRAYYAVFQAAVEAFRDRGEFSPHGHGGDHTALTDALARIPSKGHTRIAEALRRLRDARNGADYKLVRPSGTLPASTVIAQAERVLQLLAALP